MEKNTEISERVSELIDFLGLNPNEFAKELGYKRSQTVYDILNGKSSPSFDFFFRLINTEFSANINIEWLIANKGELVKSKEVINLASEPERPSYSKKEPDINYQLTIDLMHKAMIAQEKSIAAHEKTIHALEQVLALKSERTAATSVATVHK